MCVRERERDALTFRKVIVVIPLQELYKESHHVHLNRALKPWLIAKLMILCGCGCVYEGVCVCERERKRIGE